MRRWDERGGSVTDCHGRTTRQRPASHGMQGRQEEDCIGESVSIAASHTDKQRRALNRSASHRQAKAALHMTCQQATQPTQHNSSPRWEQHLTSPRLSQPRRGTSANFSLRGLVACAPLFVYSLARSEGANTRPLTSNHDGAAHPPRRFNICRRRSQLFPLSPVCLLALKETSW